MIATRKTCVKMAVQTEVGDLIERLDWQFIVVALSQAHFVVFTNFPTKLTLKPHNFISVLQFAADRSQKKSPWP